MLTRRRHLVPCLSLWIASGSFLVAACGSAPVPMVAKSGTSFALAIGGEGDVTEHIGYGSDFVGLNDQRGKLVFTLSDETSTYELGTRLVTRTVPDPASRAGLDGLWGVPLGGFVRMHQVLAVVDIPCEVLSGHYDISAFNRVQVGPDTFETLATSALTENELRHIHVERDEDCVEAFTELAGSQYGIGSDVFSDEVLEGITATLPLPKLLVRLPVFGNGVGPPAAATIELSYPVEKATIEGVFVDDIAGHRIFADYELEPPDRLRIHYVNPHPESQLVLAVVFQQRDPHWEHVVDPSDFTWHAATSSFYTLDGEPVSVPWNYDPIGPIR